MRRLLIGALFGCIVSCSNNAKAPAPVAPIVHIDTPIAPPTPTPKPIEPRSDLSSNWFEVKSDNWSYGLPLGFDPIKKHSNDVLVEHKSMSKRIAINFAVHQNDGKDFIESFIVDALTHGREVVAVMQKTDERGNLIAIQSLETTDSVSFLDFLLAKDNKYYHLSCFGLATDLKKEADTCFSVVDTLRVK